MPEVVDRHIRRISGKPRKYWGFSVLEGKPSFNFLPDVSVRGYLLEASVIRTKGQYIGNGTIVADSA
jgi:hypothetical protein